MKRICRRRLEFSLLHVEFSSIIIFGMDEQCPDSDLVGGRLHANQSITQQLTAEASFLSRHVHSEACEQNDRNWMRRHSLNNSTRGISSIYTAS